MPRKFTAHFHTTLSGSAYVTLSDEVLEGVAADYGVTVDELTLDDLRETILEEASEVLPTEICAHCTGWGEKSWAREQDGEWIWDGDDTPPDSTARAYALVER